MKVAPEYGPSGGSDLMFCCSGAADKAETGDPAVRPPQTAKGAKMFCLAGIAGDVELIVVNSQAANRMLVLDGCDSACAEKSMQKNGFNDFIHFRMTDLGWEKGKTPVTADRIPEAATQLRPLLQEAPARAEA